MPGPVSDSYDPEFSTGENAAAVRNAIKLAAAHVGQELGEPKSIVEVVNGTPGRVKHVPLSERERRVIRFALNRALETI